LWPLLPEYSRSAHAWPNGGQRLLAPLAFRVLDQERVLNVAPAPAQDPLPSGCVCLALGSQGERLHVNGPWLNELCRLVGLVGPDSGDWSQVLPDQQHFIAGWLLDDLFSRLGALLNRELSPAGGGVQGYTEEGRRFELGGVAGAAAAPAAMWLDLPELAAARLERALLNKADAFWLQVPFTASLQAGYQTLSLKQLMSLVPGDIVLLNRPLQDLQLDVSSCLLADVRTDATGHVVAGAWYLDERREKSVESIHDQDNVDEVDVLDNLTVQLVCEVGRLSMTLAELKSLQPGSVLPMDRDAGQAVDLMINGARVGQGELVRLDDSLGVRVIRLAKSHG